MTYQKQETIGNCTLYLGNCLDVLPSLPTVDAVITDPPYEAEAHNMARRQLTRGQDGGRRRSVGNFPIDFERMDDLLRGQVAQACQAVCCGWGIYFCQIEAVYLWRSAMEAAGAKYKRAGIWLKPDGAPQFTGDRPGMGFESIVCTWHGDGRSKWNGGGGRHGVWKFTKHDRGYGHGQAKNEHPTQKPLALMEALVADFTPAASVVLDPFMGSGTTGVACVSTGREFIGVEKDVKYFDVACRRIDDALRQKRMFS